MSPEQDRSGASPERPQPTRAQRITAAAFLKEFADGVAWAHLDIAGTAWAVGNRLNYCPRKGASGAIVRTFVELAKNY